ncbi:alpha/beta hydrolase [Streptomyces sp. AJS327]|uniref:alpha/beta hydrolase n=1 Tax=Streptomyces sp. AJS327 TaxID=2545265 RepID=UPI0015DF9855|nr:alpha/beta hydrolase [Streptomyces sp. AJS327]MBA0052642.1 alpha/beta hydrolase [Streptomyces sp. AJS327]
MAFDADPDPAAQHRRSPRPTARPGHRPSPPPDASPGTAPDTIPDDDRGAATAPAPPPGLDPQFRAVYERRAASGDRPLYTLTLREARAADLAAIRASSGTPEPVARVTEETFPGPGGPLPTRIYRPAGDGQLPVLVYYFGGGWTLGSLDTSDAVCRSLANAAGCLTVAVGYRLAPEHPFPAAVTDCSAGLRWAAANARRLGGDPERISVAGDSAGGNLATVTALRARATGPELSCQLLVYPNTDHRADTPSRHENTDPLLFNDRSVRWYWDNYLADPADGDSPHASPLRAPDLRGLPPTLILTAEFDPLLDEGEQYAHRLLDSGVPVQLSRYPGVAHGFFTMGGSLDAARRALAQSAAFLRSHTAPRPRATTCGGRGARGGGARGGSIARRAGVHPAPASPRGGSGGSLPAPRSGDNSLGGTRTSAHPAAARPTGAKARPATRPRAESGGGPLGAVPERPRHGGVRPSRVTGHPPAHGGEEPPAGRARP